MPDLHIYVHRCGNSSWPRFVIRNNRGEIWTGDGWTTTASKALLFNSDDEATAKVNELMLGSTERLVVTTVCIRVNRKQPFTIAELQEFLATNFQGVLLEGDFGGATFEVQPDWEDLKEIE